jgi:hypothetical protein
MPPKYLEFHLSLTAELYSIRDRMKYLVRHRLTSGEHRESALRMMLRRHLPPSLVVGRGFVVTKEDSSEQIDILVVDGTRPCLYRDGDLIIVTPDLVRAIVEVKTTCALEGRNGKTPQIVTDLMKLAEKGRLCEQVMRANKADFKIWTGFFVYDDANQPFQRVLEAIATARHETGHCLNGVSFGKRSFFRYWSQAEIAEGAIGGYEGSPCWHAYGFEQDIAASYFIGNLIDAVSQVDRTESSFAWFPLIGGKEQFRCLRLFEDNLQIADAY